MVGKRGNQQSANIKFQPWQPPRVDLTNSIPEPMQEATPEPLNPHVGHMGTPEPAPKTHTETHARTSKTMTTRNHPGSTGNRTEPFFICIDMSG